MTGIIYDAPTGDWAITVDTATGEQCEGYAATAQEAAARLEEAVDRWARHEALHNWQVARASAARMLEAATPSIALDAPQRAIEATPAALSAPAANAAQTATERPREAQARCAHYKAMRRCYAIARDLGLDTRADEAMRAAFGRFLGREVPSREALEGGVFVS